MFRDYVASASSVLSHMLVCPVGTFVSAGNAPLPPWHTAHCVVNLWPQSSGCTSDIHAALEREKIKTGEGGNPEKLVGTTLNLVKWLKNNYIIRLVNIFSKKWVDN